MIIKSKKDILALVKQNQKEGKTLGFVPTMGALHQGHLSLIAASKKACDLTICSIFVNPTQFNDSSDYDLYPRTFEKDVEMLKSVGCDYIFAPTQKEMYPEQDHRQFNFGLLESVMEGAHRPGHFNGVAQIVSKLFDVVPANKAFFGQKDFQQLTIIKALVEQLDYNIEIVACPIIREANGLAMSSRNQRLSENQKQIASEISKQLYWAKAHYKTYSVENLKREIIERFTQIPELTLEYFEIVEDKNLQPILNWDYEGKIVACIAVFCGKVRLIDNIVFNL